MIRLQRQKKIDKEKLAEERRFGPDELEIYNQIAARGDHDTAVYNERIYQPYLSQFVNRGANMNADRYRMPEMIDRNYVSAARVKEMIDQKYKKGDFYVKSIPELTKLYQVAQNVINNMEDPEDAYNTISADNTRDFSKMHQLQQQSGLSKKQWTDVLNHTASAISQCVKDNKLLLDEAKSELSISAIQDTLGIYHNIQLSGLEYVWNAKVVNMIRLQKQKAADKKKLPKERVLGPDELAIYNEIVARGDNDTTAYNERIYKPYLSQFVGRGANMNKDTYRIPEMIDRNYVSAARVREMIDNKYKKGEFYVK
jgi:hypothetical protein